MFSSIDSPFNTTLAIPDTACRLSSRGSRPCVLYDHDDARRPLAKGVLPRRTPPSRWHDNNRSAAQMATWPLAGKSSRRSATWLIAHEHFRACAVVRLRVSSMVAGAGLCRTPPSSSPSVACFCFRFRPHAYASGLYCLGVRSGGFSENQRSTFGCGWVAYHRLGFPAVRNKTSSLTELRTTPRAPGGTPAPPLLLQLVRK